MDLPQNVLQLLLILLLLHSDALKRCVDPPLFILHFLLGSVRHIYGIVPTPFVLRGEILSLAARIRVYVGQSREFSHVEPLLFWFVIALLMLTLALGITAN